jgi:hypothetical protein
VVSYPVERIVWIDSMGLENGEWMRVRDVPAELEPGNLRVESVGYVVEETEHALALAHTRSLWEDDAAVPRVSNVMVIPLGAIVEREQLSARAKAKAS